MNKENSSSRILSVYAGAAAPRNMFEIAIAMEGELARKAMQAASPPRPRPAAVPLPVSPLRAKQKEWEAVFMVWFILFFIACAFFG